MFLLYFRHHNPADSARSDKARIMKNSNRPTWFRTSILFGRTIIPALAVALTCANAQTTISPVLPEPIDYTHTYDSTALSTTGVIALRSIDSNLTGSGVNVAHVEARTNDTDPPQFEVDPSDVSRSVTSSPFNWGWLSYQGTSRTYPNTVGIESSHANQVGELFYSNATTGGQTRGAVPGVSIVDNYEANYFSVNRIQGFPNLQPQALEDNEKVANQCFVFNTGQETGLDSLWDNYVATFGTISVAALGSSTTNNGRPSSPATAYNTIAVGAFGGSSAVGPTLTGGRSKPDITAPGDFTSFSTPLVSGAAAILVQAAGSTVDANDPRTVKALLLNGAVKPLLLANPSDRWTRSGTAPLDSRYGAGNVNVFNSYKQLQAGRRAPGIYSGVHAGWDFNSVSATSSKTYTLTLNSGTYNGTATLVWHRQNNQSSINDLNLSLWSGTTQIASSASTVDNVEHLFLQSLPAGTYDLKVERTSGGLSGNEDYALAFNFSPIQLTSAVSRKTHSTAGAFDVPLPLTGAAGIECRSGGAGGQHQVIFTFAVPVSLDSARYFFTDGSGNHITTNASASGSGTSTITLDLSGVPNAQTSTVALYGVNDGTNIDDVGVKVGFLLGDTSASGAVNSGDAIQVRNNSGQSTTGSNFRTDVNSDGAINSGDATIVRTNSGQALP